MKETQTNDESIMNSKLPTTTGGQIDCKVGRIAMVDENNIFHCQCGATHERGAINGLDVYRCLKCGHTYKVKNVVALR